MADCTIAELECVYAVHRFTMLDSTNRWAHDNCTVPPTGLTVVWAERQTAGHGRQGRTFYSNSRKGLWISLIMPLAALERHFTINRSLSLAICRAIERLSPAIHPRIKWPNDIYCGHKKICGILLEAMHGDRTGIVAGFGLNVNTMPADFPPDIRQIATSLAIETGENFTTEGALRTIIEELDRSMNADPAGEHQEYCERLYGRGELVRVGTHEGIFETVARSGLLRIRTETGAADIPGGTLQFLTRGKDV